MHLETTCTKPVVSYEEASFTKPDLRKVANSSEDQGKGWWSQRDLNPCLSLESRY
ncbi:MAG: hypothetical protein U0T81_19795 [Saprospiraceae bacterium]